MDGRVSSLAPAEGRLRFEEAQQRKAAIDSVTAPRPPRTRVRRRDRAPNTYAPRTCANCGDTFTPKTGSQRYCTRVCLLAPRPA